MKTLKLKHTLASGGNLMPQQDQAGPAASGILEIVKMSTDQQIIEAVKQAVALHRDSKKNMEARLCRLLDPLPGTTVLAVAGFPIAYRTVYAACSQWASHDYPCTGEGSAYVIDGDFTIGEIDCSFFDGSNHQYQFGGVFLDREKTRRLRTARAELLREIARELPEALLQYAECCRKGAAHNDQAAAN